MIDEKSIGQTRPISKRQLEMAEMPTIASQLPVKAGRIDLTVFHGSCARCKQTIPEDKLTGTVRSPIDTVTVVEAVGICEPCRLLTPFLMRFRHNGFVEYQQDGKWVRAKFGAPSFWSKSWEALCLFLGFIPPSWKRS